MFFLFNYSVITGVSLSFILFIYGKGFKSANKFLAAFYFFASIFFFSLYVAIFSKSAILVALFSSTLSPFAFLIGPFAYLYVRSILRDNSSLSKKDFLHFLLFVVQFIGLIPYYFSPWQYKLDIANRIVSNNWQITEISVNKIFVWHIINNAYLRPLHLFCYVICIWYLEGKYYFKYKNKTTKVPDAQRYLIRRWLFAFTIILSVVSLTYLILTFHSYIYQSKVAFHSSSQFYFIIGIIAIASLNLSVFLLPEILYGLPRINDFQNSNNKRTALQKVPKSELEPKYLLLGKDENAHSKLENAIPNIASKLENLMLSGTLPWTKNDFSIGSLAVLLKIPEHHLRYYFNYHLGINFSEYRNKLRVEHTKQILEKGDYAHLSIEGIGRVVGFTSKSNFFAVFKDLTGMTPHEFMASKKMAPRV